MRNLVPLVQQQILWPLSSSSYPSASLSLSSSSSTRRPPPPTDHAVVEWSHPDLVDRRRGSDGSSGGIEGRWIAQLTAVSSSDDDDMVVAVSPHGHIATFAREAFREAADVKQQPTVVATIPNVDPNTCTIVSMHYLSELDVCCIALSNGEIYTLTLRTHQLECVGSVDGGLFAMEWSPDQELAILATGNETLIQMTKYFDVLAEFPMHVEDEGAEKPVNVGWGKEETQFQGSKGREHLKAKKEKQDIPATEFSVLREDDLCPRLSWRGDGRFFACSAVDPSTNTRVIRIYDREGVLQCTNEKLRGLSHCLNWRPSGNLIAASQKLEHKQSVVFFEKNGLAHGEFELLKVDVSSKVRDVFWNADSSILCLLLQRGSDEQPQSVFQLWTMNNYHWYLKYECVDSKHPITALKWDPEHSYRLHVGFADGRYAKFDFCYDVTTSTSLTADNAAAVIVIDGLNLLITPFRFMGVPPPMSTFKTSHASAVSEVAFGGWDVGGSNCYAVLFASESISATIDFYDLPVQGKSCRPPRLLGHLSLDGLHREMARYRHLCWPRKNLILLVEARPNVGDSIVACQLHWPDPSGVADEERAPGIEIVHFVRRPCPDLVLRLHDSPSAKVVMLQTRNGDLFSVRVDKNLSLTERVAIQPWHYSSLSPDVVRAPGNDDSDNDGGEENGAAAAGAQLPITCPWMRVVEIASAAASKHLKEESSTSSALEPLESASTPSPSKVFRVFALSERCKFFVDGEEISADCTSFVLHNEFLVFTTLAHRVHFLPLSMPLSEVKSALQKASSSMLPASANASSSSSPPSAHHRTPMDETVRSVERGSKVVTVVPHDVSLVLQMPRGNLEIICPRALALSAIRENIGVQNYGNAFLMARKHRIDLNILFDSDPVGFMDGLGTFLRQVSDVDHLNLFLSTLRNEDTTVTMYPSMSQTPAMTAATTTTMLQEEQRAAQSVFDTEQKVNRIASAIRDWLEAAAAKGDKGDEGGRKKYLRCILTSYAVQTPPDLEGALRLIRSVYETSEATPVAEARAAQREAESLLSYAIFLVDVNKLYDVALGMYDLGLVLLIAQKSQKDPKEYIPFLSGLRKMETFQQRFTIDDHLKRHSSAMENMSRTPNCSLPELLQYIQRHRLYLDALRFFEDKEDLFRAVMKIYAGHLEDAGIHLEAGLAYHRANLLEEALACYQRAGQWRRALGIAQRLNYEPDRLRHLALSLAHYLKDQANYADAAIVYDQYLDHPEEAVKCLVTGSLFAEAERICYHHRRADLMETVIVPGAIDAYASASTEISNLIALFDKQIRRLAVVRENKQRWIDMVHAGTAATTIPLSSVDFDNVDMFSETSSIASNTRSKRSTTSQTNRKTGKSKRKAERRKASGKEGSRFEEEYLLDSLCRTVHRSNALRNDVHELLHFLVFSERMGESRSLQRQFQTLLDLILQSLPKLAPPIILPAREDDTEEDQKGVPEFVKPVLSTQPWSLDVLSTPSPKHLHSLGLGLGRRPFSSSHH